MSVPYDQIGDDNKELKPVTDYLPASPVSTTAQSQQNWNDDDVNRLLDAMQGASKSQESSGNYQVKPNARTGATGGYQVMQANIPNWTQKWAGRSMTPEEFQNDSKAQDAVYRGQMGEYIRGALKAAGGDRAKAMRMAAAAWYGPGEKAYKNYDSDYRPAPNEPSFKEYTSSVANKANANMVNSYLGDDQPAQPNVANYLGDQGPQKPVVPGQPAGPGPTNPNGQTLRSPIDPNQIPAQPVTVDQPVNQQPDQNYMQQAGIVATPEQTKQQLLTQRQKTVDDLNRAKTPARRNILLGRIKDIDDALLKSEQTIRANQNIQPNNLKAPEPANYVKRDLTTFQPGQQYFQFEKTGKLDNGDVYLGAVDGKYRFREPGTGDEYEVADPAKGEVRYIGPRKIERDDSGAAYIRDDNQQNLQQGQVRRYNEDVSGKRSSFVFSAGADGKQSIREENPKLVLGTGDKQLKQSDDQTGVPKGATRVTNADGLTYIAQPSKDGQYSLKAEGNAPADQLVRISEAAKTGDRFAPQTKSQNTQRTRTAGKPGQYPFEKAGVLTLTNGQKMKYLGRDGLQDGQYRFADDDGATYVWDRNNNKAGLQPEKSAPPADEFDVNLLPESEKYRTTPEAGKAVIAGQVAQHFLEKFDIPKSDTEEYYRQKGFRDLTTGEQVSDPNRFVGSADRPTERFAVSKTDLKQIQDFSAKRRKSLEDEALATIASGAPISPELRQFYKENDLDVDKLESTRYSDYKMAQAKAEVAKRDLDKYVEELRSGADTPTTRSLNKVLSDYSLQPTDETAARIVAARRVGSLGEQQMRNALGSYAQARENIRTELRDAKLSFLKQTGDQQSNLGESIRTGTVVHNSPEVSDAEVDQAIAEAKKIALSPDERRQAILAGRAKESQLKSVPLIGNYLAAFSTMGPSAVSGFVKTAAGASRIASMFGSQADQEHYVALARLAQKIDLETAQVGNQAPYTKAGAQMIGGLPEIIALSKTPLGLAGSFAFSDAAKSLGSGEQPIQAAQKGEKGLAIGSAFTLAEPVANTVMSGLFNQLAPNILGKVAPAADAAKSTASIGELSGDITEAPNSILSRLMPQLLSKETQEMLKDPETLKELTEAHRLGMNYLLEPDLRKLLAGAGIVKEGARLGTIAAATGLIEAKDSGDASQVVAAMVQNVVMDAVMTHADAVGKSFADALNEFKGRVFDVRTADGMKTVTIDNDGSLITWDKIPEAFKDGTLYAKDVTPKSGGLHPQGMGFDEPAQPAEPAEPVDTRTPQQRADEFLGGLTPEEKTEINKPVTITGKDGKSYEVLEDRGDKLKVQEVKDDGSKGSITLQGSRKFTDLEGYRNNENTLSEPSAPVEPSANVPATETASPDLSESVPAPKPSKPVKPPVTQGIQLEERPGNGKPAANGKPKPAATTFAEAMNQAVASGAKTIQVNGKSVGDAHVWLAQNEGWHAENRDGLLTLVKDENGQPAIDATTAAIGQAVTGTAPAHDAATSPHNDLPEPTQPQKEAGNYQKGHLKINGLDISIENPVGSKRSGVSPEGKPWSVTMKQHYGYIKRTVGADEEQIDTFVKDGTPADYAGRVYIIDQQDPKTTEFDEHKVMLGYDTEEEARKAYLSNYEKGWKGLRNVTSLPFENFKQWALTGVARRKPASQEDLPAPDFAGTVSQEGIDSLTPEQLESLGKIMDGTATDADREKLKGIEVTKKNGKVTVSKPEKADTAVDVPGGEGLPLIMRSVPNRGGAGKTWQVYHADSDTVLGRGKTRQQAIDDAARVIKARGNLIRSDLGMETEPEFYHNGRPAIELSRPADGKTKIMYLDGGKETPTVLRHELESTPTPAPEPVKSTSDLFREKLEKLRKEQQPETPEENDPFDDIDDIMGFKSVIEPAFDEEKYSKLKPAFEKALATFEAESPDDAMEQFLRKLNERYDLDKIAQLEPFIVKFMDEKAPTESTEQPTAEILKPGTQDLIAEIAGRLNRNESISWQELDRMADTAFGGSRAAGRYEPKDMYDAMEAAVVRHLNNFEHEYKLSDDPKYADAVLGKLRKLVDLLPTQRTRTDEQIKFQQFSTPPTIAYTAGVAAAFDPSDTVLEPSAGTGMLAVWPHNAGVAHLFLNEIAPRRRSLLEGLGIADQVTSADAQFLNSLLPADIKPSVIIMNPPFSSTGGRTKANRTEYGNEHITQALARLDDGGRLVAIVGESLNFNRSTQLNFWRKTMSRYNVRANIAIPGQEYQSYGTNFGTQLVVIDKTGPTPGADFAGQLENVVSAAPENLEGVLDAVIPIAKTRIITGTDLEGSSGNSRPGTSGPSDTDAGGNANASGRRPNNAAGKTPSNGATQGTSTTPRPEPGSELQQPAGSDTSTETEGTERGTRPVQRDLDEAGVTYAGDTDRRENDDATFVRYRPAKLQGGVPHPANIVESASMAAVDPPDIHYTPQIDPKVIKSGALSDLQLERVIYAGQRHEMRLPDGNRAGYFAGDGTGVGKSRMGAGIAIDNWNQGRRRILMLSVNYDLLPSTKEAIAALGSSIPVKSMNRIKSGTSIDMGERASKLSKGQAAGKDGVLFASYATLIKEPRFNAIVDWLGSDGVIIFDEAHRAKNAVASGRGKASQTAQRVLDLQSGEKASPDSRITYMSATGATDVRNMAYMTRLGLWGTGTAFPSFQAFQAAIEMGGVGAMEMVSRDMKASGMYGAVQISMRGVTYRELEHRVLPEQERLYNLSARAWQTVLQNMDEAIKDSGASSQARAMAMQAFYGSQQRFFRMLLTALKVPTLIEDIERTQREGSTYIDPTSGQERKERASVIIKLIGTSESRTKEEVSKALAEGRSFDDLDFSPKGIITSMVQRAFPTDVWTDATNDAGETIRVRVLNADGTPAQDPELVAKRDEILRGLDTLVLPESPLDQIIGYFGPDKVAEITGRSKRLVRDPDTGETKYVKRAEEGVSSEMASQHEMDAFQDGRKRIAVISEAAGTGISLHAANDRKNKDRRVFYTLETGWSADQELQAMGRPHRTNQRIEPEMALLATNIGGEKRFLSTIAKRLASLGALTRGDRSASGGNLAKFDFESTYGDAATRAVVSRIAAGEIPEGWGPFQIEGENIDYTPMQVLAQMGIAIRNAADELQVPDKTVDEMIVGRFLNRVLALEVPVQNFLFNHFVETLEKIIDAEKAAGKFDEGVADIKGENIRVAEDAKTVARDPVTGAETKYYQLDVEEKTAPVAFSELPTADNAGASGKSNRFYQQKRSKNIIFVRETGGITDAATGTVHHNFRVTRPGGKSFALVSHDDLNEKYEPVDAAQKVDVEPTTKENPNPRRMTVKDWWKEQYDETPKFKTERYHIIGGALLPVWDRLRGVVASEGHPIKVVRAEAQDGTRIVGVRVPETRISTLLRHLGAGESARSAEDVFDAVWNTGQEITLAGNITLKRSRLRGAPAIVLQGAPQSVMADAPNLGLIRELINYRTTLFVPTDQDAGIAALAKLLERHPVIEEGDEEPDSMKSIVETVPNAFYSRLEKVIDDKMPNRADAKTIQGIVKNAQGMKADDPEWQMLNVWLADQNGSVSKSDVLQFIQANQVQVQDIVLDADKAAFERPNLTLPGPYSNYKEEFILAPREAGDWTDGHIEYLGVRNPITRLRYDDRQTTDGESMLFGEENQQPTENDYAKMPKIYQKYGELIGWKKLLYRAVAGGYDWIGFTTGEQQVDRSDLSKDVDRITWAKNQIGGGTAVSIYVKGKADPIVQVAKDLQDLARYVGKSQAKRITEGPDHGTLSGVEDLRVGGEELSRRYDAKHVDMLNRYLKPWGAKVEPVSVDTGEYKVNRDWHTPPFRLERQSSPDIISRHDTADEAWQMAEQLGATQVYGVRVTPELEDAFLHDAQPLFRKGSREGLNETEQDTFDEMQRLADPDTKFVELLKPGRADLLRTGDRIRINAVSHEIYRRALEQVRIDQGKATLGSKKDAEDLFEGAFSKPETVQAVVQKLRDKAAEAVAKNYSPAEVSVLKQHADELAAAAKADEGTAILFVFDRALPEETFHQADYLGAADKSILNRHSDAEKQILDRHKVTSEMWKRYYSRFNEYSRIKSNPVLKAVLRAEIAPHLLELNADELATLGLTPQDKADYLYHWFKGYAEKNGIDSLDRFEKEELDVQEFTQKIKAAHAGNIPAKASGSNADGVTNENGDLRQGGPPDTGEPKPDRSSEAQPDADNSGQNGRPAAGIGTQLSSADLLPGQKLASLPMTLRRAGLDADDVVYDVFGDTAARAEAERLINENGIDGTIKILREVSNPDTQHAAAAFMIQRMLQDRAATIAAERPEEAALLRQYSLQLGRELAQRYTAAGRFVRTASVIPQSVEGVLYAAQGVVTDTHGADRTLSPEEWDRVEAAGRELEEAHAKIVSLQKEKQLQQAKIRRLQAEKEGKVRKRRASSSQKARRKIVDLVKKARDSHVAEVRARLHERFAEPDTGKSVFRAINKHLEVVSYTAQDSQGSLYKIPLDREDLLDEQKALRKRRASAADWQAFGDRVRDAGIPPQTQDFYGRQISTGEPDILKRLAAEDFDEQTINDLAEVGAMFLTEGLAGDSDYLPEHFHQDMINEFGDIVGPYFQEVYMRAWNQRNEWLNDIRETESKERVREKYGEELEDWEVDEILGQQKEKAAHRRAIETFHRYASKAKPKNARQPAIEKLIAQLAPDADSAIGAAMHLENLNPQEFYKRLLDMGIDSPSRQRDIFRRGKGVYEQARREYQIDQDRVANQILKANGELQTIDDLRWKARERDRQARTAVGNELRRIKEGEFWYRTGQVVNISNAMRTMMASGDMSGVLRQGGFMTFARPEKMGPAIKAVFKSIKSTGYGRVIQSIEQMPLFTLMQRSGISFATAGQGTDESSMWGEELFKGEQTIEHIPIVGTILGTYLIKPSERTYTGFLDMQRAVCANVFFQDMLDQGLTFQRNANEFKKVAEFINIATGRGKIPTQRFAKVLMDLPLFAPRYTLSRLQLLNMTLNPVAYYNMPPAARKIVAKTAVRFYGTLGTLFGLLGLIGAAAGVKLIGMDPDDDDFGKIIIGNTKLDIFAGTLQPAKMIIKIVDSAIRTKGGFDNRLSGEFAWDSASAIGRFIRGKLSPGFSLGVDFALDSDYVGNKFRWTPELLSRIMPLTIGDTYQAYQQDGLVGAGIALPSTWFGLGVSTYPPRQEQPETAAEKLAAKAASWNLPARSGGKDQDEQAALKTRQELTKRPRDGEDVTADANAALKAGQITKEQKNDILDAREKSYLVDKAEGLSLDEKQGAPFFKVWQAATPDERQQLQFLFDRKMKDLEKDGKLKPEFRKKLEAAGAHVAGDVAMPSAVEDVFNKYDISEPDVGMKLTPRKGEAKQKLTPDQYENYRRETLTRIYDEVNQKVMSDEFQQADDTHREMMIRRIITKARTFEQKETKRELRPPVVQ